MIHLSTAFGCVEQTAGAQRRVGWILTADELTPGSEGAGRRQRSVVSAGSFPVELSGADRLKESGQCLLCINSGGWDN